MLRRHDQSRLRRYVRNVRKARSYKQSRLGKLTRRVRTPRSRTSITRRTYL